MRLHITTTDTGETITLDGDDTDGLRRFVGNSLATMDVSGATTDGFEGPAVIIRWIPDTKES